MDVCVGLVDTNPMQLERAQTDVVCSRYHVLFILPNRQKKMMTLQSVQCHVVIDCTVCTTIQMMQQGTFGIDMDRQVDDSGSDMCHHCKGDTWHVRTVDVAGLNSLYDMWR
jgi:hypothetical protein